MSEVSVAAVPPRSVDIVAAVHAHEVVEVDFVDSLILCLGEVELVRHFIGKEEGFGARLVVCHCCGRDGYRHHHCQGHHLLHNCIFLKGDTTFVSYLWCKDRAKVLAAKGNKPKERRGKSYCCVGIPPSGSKKRVFPIGKTRFYSCVIRQVE